MTTTPKTKVAAPVPAAAPATTPAKPAVAKARTTPTITALAASRAVRTPPATQPPVQPARDAAAGATPASTPATPATPTPVAKAAKVTPLTVTTGAPAVTMPGPAHGAEAPTRTALPLVGTSTKDDFNPKVKDPAAPPAPTDAAALDAAVPATQRPAQVEQQQAAQQQAEAAGRDAARRFGEDATAVERQELDQYYDAHPTYVDPATGRVYAVEYDPTTGELTGTRTADTPLAPPGAATSTGKPGASVAEQLAPPATSTTVIVVLPDGSTVARQEAPDHSREQDDPPMDGATRRRFDYDADGSMTSGWVGATYSGDVEGGGSRTVAERTDYGAGGVRTTSSSDERTVRGDGTSYTHGVETTYDAQGADPVQEVRRDTMHDSGTDASEVHTVEFGPDGVPEHEAIERDLSTFGGLVQASQRDELTYDSQGRITDIDSDYDPSEGDALNAQLRRIAPESEERAYFAFGRVETIPHTTDDGFDYGIVTGPGASITYHGTTVTVEGADPSVNYPRGEAPAGAGDDRGLDWTDQQRFDAIRDQYDQLPPQIASSVNQLRFVFQPGLDNNGAEAWASGDREIVFPNGLSQTSVLFHEAAHTADSDTEGSGRTDEWRAAAEADAQTRADVLATIPDGATVTGARTDLAPDGIGVTGYGTDDLNDPDDPRAQEDWADATVLYLQSQRDGGIIHVTNPDGSERWITFEELYPERAAILDEYYDGLEGWDVPPAEFPGTPVDGYPAPTAQPTGSIGGKLDVPAGAPGAFPGTGTK